MNKKTLLLIVTSISIGAISNISAGRASRTDTRAIEQEYADIKNSPEFIAFQENKLESLGSKKKAFAISQLITKLESLQDAIKLLGPNERQVRIHQFRIPDFLTQLRAKQQS